MDPRDAYAVDVVLPHTCDEYVLSIAADSFHGAMTTLPLSGCQDSASPKTSNTWFEPNDFNSFFNGTCSPSSATHCDVKCENLVECLNSERNSKLS